MNWVLLVDGIEICRGSRIQVNNRARAEKAIDPSASIRVEKAA